MMESSTTVHFERAPIVEAAHGVYFTSVPGWDLLDFGRLAHSFETRYPRHEFKLPIAEPAQLQNQLVASLQTQDLGKVPVRCWFVSADGADLAQIQDNCLIHNWRRISSAAMYPGYNLIHPRFKDDWDTFQSFLLGRGIGAQEIWKCELTYVDQFVRGAEWRNFSDLPKIYRLWRGMESDAPVASLEFASFQVNYAANSQGIRLLFASQPTIRTTDGEEVLQLTITAMGKPASSRNEDVFEWFGRAHETLIEGFLKFTTPEVQERWK